MSETSITVIGNVVRRVEIRNTNSGAKVTKFSVASSKPWKGDNGWEQTETSYFDVECWGKLAEHVNNTLYKGQSVIVHGNIRTDRWKDDNGEDRQKQKIVAKAIGPNLRHHLAEVKTLKAQPHEDPAGLAEDSFDDTQSDAAEGSGTANASAAAAGTSVAQSAGNSAASAREATKELAGAAAGAGAGAGAGAAAGAGAGSGEPPF